MTPRLESCRRAVARLKEVLAEPETPIQRDAAIQRFEFCFELAWKCIQDSARAAGLECASPKSCMRVAFRQDWVNDEKGWLAILEDRNRTSHTYDEKLAASVYRNLASHATLLERLVERLAQEDAIP